MKKLLSLMLCLVLMASLVGCGSGTATTATTAAATTAAAAETTAASKDAATTEAASGEAQKLVVWAWDQNLPSIEYAAKTYKEANPSSNVEVVVQSVPDTVDKMSTFFASGVGTDLPDLVLMDNIQIQAFLQQFPDKFVNLSTLGFDEFKDSFSKAHWELLSHEGAIYAFPFDIAPIMMEVNTDITTKAGVDPTKWTTWEAMMADTQKVNDAGFAMTLTFSEGNLIQMMQSAGVGLFNEKGEIDLLNPKTVEIVELYKKLQASNTSDKTTEDGAMFGKGEVAALTKPAWAIGEDMPGQPDLAGKVTLVPMPKVKEADGYNASANDGGSSFFILSTSKVQEAAYEIGKIITTDLESQKIALKQGLMPGYLPAADLDELKAGVDYYGGEAIWSMLSKSAADTQPIYVNEFYPAAKDIFKNTVVDSVKAGTDKSAKDLLQEAADLIASQTGLSVAQY